MRLSYPRPCRYCHTWTLPHDLADHEHACRPQPRILTSLSTPDSQSEQSSDIDKARRILENLGDALGRHEIRRRGLPDPPYPRYPPAETSGGSTGSATYNLQVGWKQGRTNREWSNEALLHQTGLIHIDQLRQTGLSVPAVLHLTRGGHGPRLHELGVTPTWLRQHGATQTIFGGTKPFDARDAGLTQSEWRTLGVQDPVADLGLALSDWVVLES